MEKPNDVLLNFNTMQFKFDIILILFRDYVLDNLYVWENKPISIPLVSDRLIYEIVTELDPDMVYINSIELYQQNCKPTIFYSADKFQKNYNEFLQLSTIPTEEDIMNFLNGNFKIKSYKEWKYYYDEVYKYITYDYEKIKYIINYNFLQSFNSIEATDKELYKNIKMHLDSFYLNKLDGMNIKESQRRMKFIYRTRYG